MRAFHRLVASLAIALAAPPAMAQACLNNVPPSGAAWSLAGDEATDVSTGLVWKRCPEGQTWSGSACTGTAQTVAWAGALVLANGQAGGGWRLPNAKELHSMVDAQCTAATDPAANPLAFPGHPKTSFWSSTPGWAVNFSDGSLLVGQTATTAMNVRLVRDGNAQGAYAAGHGVDANCDFGIPGDRHPSALLENADGTVTDGSTGLVWTRCAVGMSWSGGRCINPASSMNWQGALAAAATAGDGWRLPNAKELASLADQRCANPAVNGQKFPDQPQSAFWSSTPGWAVDFSDGSLLVGQTATTAMNVRLVRDGNAQGAYAAGHGADTNCDFSIPGDRPPGALLENADGTVTDGSTGLVWTRCAVGMSWSGGRCINPASSLNWQGALAAAAAAGGGWRLPNAKELASLADQRCANPAVNGQKFPDQPQSAFWSSTPEWAVSFADGSLLSGQAATTAMNVRLVRDGNAVAGYRGASGSGRCSPDIPGDFKRGNWLVHANGTANDRSAGLVWDRCLLGQTWSGSECTGTPATYTWQTALQQASAATAYGQSDWRLPNLKELDSITDRRCSDPALHPEVFRTPPATTWTATPGWAVSSVDGSVLAGQSAAALYTVRLVRDGGASPILLPPVLNAPGYAVSPGPILSTLTPSFEWQPVPGATGYGLYIRDLSSNVLVYPNAAGITATPLTGNGFILPAGYLKPNRQYKWNMTSFSGDAEFVPDTGTNPSRWFQTSNGASATASFGLTAGAPYCDLSQATPRPAVKLVWTPFEGASAYRLKRNGVQVGSDLSDNQHAFDNVAGLVAGKTYSYLVTAVTASGTSSTNTAVVPIPATVCDASAQGTAIAGKVVAGGAALAGVTLTASGANVGTRLTGADGRYAFDNASLGSTVITPSRSGYSFSPAAAPVNLSVPSSVTLGFRACELGRTLSGTVRNAAGSPVGGAQVKVGDRPAVGTDGTGGYSVAGLACGPVTMTVKAAGYSDYSQAVDTFDAWTLNVDLSKPGSDFGLNTPAGKAADPVNTAIGNYIYEHKDLQIPGKGMPFAFQRSYNSQDGGNGPLGYGWTHSLNTRLDVDGDGNVALRGGDGKNATFVPDGQGGFKSQYGVFDVLALNGDGTYTLTQANQTAHRFNADRQLASITDRNGNAITLVYTGGKLTRVVDTAGRNIDFGFDGANRITAVTDPIGRVVRFAYDGAGNLVAATDAKGNVTRYTYDSDHQMLTLVDPRGSQVVSNSYDDSVPKRVVTTQRDAKGGRTDYVYDPINHVTVFTDALGNATTHRHDDKNRLIQEDDASGNSQLFTYDDAGNRSSVTDRNGNKTTYAYDPRGNVTGKTDPLNATSTITYDSTNNPLTRTDALGGVTRFSYDANGNLTQTTDALGNVAGATYQANGLPLTLTDARGNTTTNTYDSQGNLIRVANALGNFIDFSYDGVGRKLTKKDALDRVTTYVYDAVDNLISVTDATGHVKSTTYDGNSNRIGETDRRGSSTLYAYDVKDLLVTTTDALGGVIANTYDANDRKTSVTDPRGNVTHFAYDAVGNLVSSTDPLGKVSQFNYDGAGNRLAATDPLGHTGSTAYDALNRKISVTDALGNVSTSSYDLLGRVLSTTNAKGQATAFAYDALGRLLQVTDANNATVQYAYDANGNRTAMTDPMGHVTGYAYDALNRLITRTEALGNVTRYQYDAVGNRNRVTQPDGSIIQYAYDTLDRLVTVTYPDSSTVTFAYDANGNRTRMTDSLGTSLTQFDALNRIISFTDPFGKVVGYAYDAAGNRTQMVYPGGKTVSYGYDSLNRMSSVTDWLNRGTSYTYDAAGRLMGSSNPNGTTAANSYDSANRLTGLANQSGAGVISNHAFTLDALGNHTAATNVQPLQPMLAAGSRAYVYDTENRMTGAGAGSNSFDANGNQTTRGSDGLAYDVENRLKQSTLAGVTAQYQYDGLGNRFARTSGGGTTRYVLDPSTSLTRVLAETDGSGTVTAYYVHGLGLVSRILPDGTPRYYHYDSRGSTLALTDGSGAITDRYAYEPFGKLANSQGATPNPYKYVGAFGVMDEGNGLSYIRARYYDPDAGRFISKDPKAGSARDGQSLNRYVYALNNPVMLFDISGFSARDARGVPSMMSSSDRSHETLLTSGKSSTANTVGRGASILRFLSNAGKAAVGAIKVSEFFGGKTNLGGPLGTAYKVTNTAVHAQEVIDEHERLVQTEGVTDTQAKAIIGIGELIGGYTGVGESTNFVTRNLVPAAKIENEAWALAYEP